MGVFYTHERYSIRNGEISVESMTPLIRPVLLTLVLISMILAGMTGLPFNRSIFIAAGMMLVIWLLQTREVLKARIARFREREFWRRGQEYQMIILLIVIIILFYFGLPAFFYWIGASIKNLWIILKS